MPTIKCLRVSFSHEVEEYDSNKERVISIIVIVCKMWLFLRTLHDSHYTYTNYYIYKCETCYIPGCVNNWLLQRDLMAELIHSVSFSDFSVKLQLIQCHAFVMCFVYIYIYCLFMYNINIMHILISFDKRQTDRQTGFLTVVIRPLVMYIPTNNMNASPSPM